ncbi:FmdB family zinc ribbon protein [Propionibacterium acidifaciens]|uniref:Zinc ribbon domain protein n=1 Tax=Propionibacterium acidifaciens F0233 TaxID=553198 RepID=U2QU38_9ACTN|nr:FmdB family zinc ribbon protein [Propionibacterium acidifaciens]AYW77380.1 FmdB family transcriptional regulator [Propionibacterium acidifaciens]ERK60026.1 zinc ribbon domain protein [Propionibacterium acidifaciens F0233]
MPTYQYQCNACGNELEVFQKFTDDPLTVCPSCRGRLRKVYSAVGVVFKGSGFYATDNRSHGAASAAVPAASHHDAESGGSSDGSGSETGAAKAGSTVATGSAPGDSAA